MYTIRAIASLVTPLMGLSNKECHGRFKWRATGFNHFKKSTLRCSTKQSRVFLKILAEKFLSFILNEKSFKLCRRVGKTRDLKKHKADVRANKMQLCQTQYDLKYYNLHW